MSLYQVAEDSFIGSGIRSGPPGPPEGSRDPGSDCQELGVAETEDEAIINDMRVSGREESSPLSLRPRLLSPTCSMFCSASQAARSQIRESEKLITFIDVCLVGMT